MKKNTTQRCFEIVEILSKNLQHGLTNKEIAHCLKISEPISYRDLKLLESMGHVRRLHGGYDKVWILTNKLVVISHSVKLGIAQAEQELINLKNRYTRRN